METRNTFAAAALTALLIEKGAQWSTPVICSRAFSIADAMMAATGKSLFTQEEVNKLLATERRRLESKAEPASDGEKVCPTSTT